ncbi:DNA polymerase theta short isoform [Heterostelium album PN500]|uniref:DNA-directed DNA polymerase n=1 Tax=Heterostelium pallidum (strain ATCC 26659 / Pp 5 / PN500) TaxID=670386 RepID=D3BAN9_HETP5|nr:DNA polymerase theta short isoform [Heterostelium album PN500]EFA81626.1 DNA polymerase theta short isoform [Heterostelium album PN500]|eukprot:XP_020433743.1 DNA polymerase theta short isoform [Heterostelium album PN500]
MSMINKNDISFDFDISTSSNENIQLINHQQQQQQLSFNISNNNNNNISNDSFKFEYSDLDIKINQQKSQLNKNEENNNNNNNRDNVCSSISTLPSQERSTLPHMNSMMTIDHYRKSYNDIRRSNIFSFVDPQLESETSKILAKQAKFKCLFSAASYFNDDDDNNNNNNNKSTTTTTTTAITSATKNNSILKDSVYLNQEYMNIDSVAGLPITNDTVNSATTTTSTSTTSTSKSSSKRKSNDSSKTKKKRHHEPTDIPVQQHHVEQKSPTKSKRKASRSSNNNNNNNRVKKRKSNNTDINSQTTTTITTMSTHITTTDMSIATATSTTTTTIPMIPNLLKFQPNIKAHSPQLLLPLPQPQPPIQPKLPAQKQLQILPPQQNQIVQPKPLVLNYSKKKQIIQNAIKERNEELDTSFESSNSGGCGSFNPEDLQFHPAVSFDDYTNTKIKQSVPNLPDFDRNTLVGCKQYGLVNPAGFKYEIRHINDRNIEWFRKVWPMQFEYSISLCFSLKMSSNNNNNDNNKNNTTTTSTAKIDIELVMNDEETFFLPKLFHVESIIVSWSPGLAVYQLPLAPSGGVADFKQSFYNDNWKLVKQVLEYPYSYKHIWNSKPQLKILLSKGISLKHRLIDPKIALWLTDSDLHKDKKLEYVYMDNAKGSKKMIGATKFHNISKLATRSGSTNHFDLAYQACYQTLILSQRLLKQLDPSSLKILFEIEMPVTPILARMEFIGIGFDDEICQNTRELVQKKIDYLIYKAHLLVPRLKLDMESKIQMSDVMYNWLKLTKPDSRTNKKVLKESYSTNAHHLETISHEHPFPNILMEYRKLSHHINNYADELRKYCYRSTDNSMRIYSTILQTIVPTGRLAMVFPNLQSIAHPIEFKVAPTFTPSPLSIASNSSDIEIPAVDLENHSSQYNNLVAMESKCETLSIKIRDSFLPKQGYIFLSADYSQIELRILAHFSQDPKLLEIFNNSTVDVFKLISHQMSKIPLEQIKDSDRTIAKHLCYGILYGMGIGKLAHDLNTTKDKAKAALLRFKTTYQVLTDYLTSVGDSCLKNGFVETFFGRKRYFREVFEVYKDTKVTNEVKESAKRKAKNTIPQGTAADISKLAMIQVDKKLNERGIPAEIVLQVHDELLLEVPESQLAEVALIVKESMESAAKLSIPIPIKMSIGKCWGSLQSYELPTTTTLNTQYHQQ